MSRRTVGFVVLLLGSLVLGVFAGDRFFSLFEKTVPPAMLTSFNRSTVKMAFLGYGAITGLAMFLWTLAVTMISPFFRQSKSNSVRSPRG